MTPEQEIQARIATQIGNLVIQVTSLQVQIEALNAKLAEQVKPEKPK